MDIELVEIQMLDKNRKEEWNDFVASCPMGTIYQSYEWSIEMERVRYKPIFLMMKKKGDIRAGGAVFLRFLPGIRKPVAILPWGPVWNGDCEILSDFIDNLIQFLDGYGPIHIDFELSVPYMINNKMCEEAIAVIEVLKGKRFHLKITNSNLSTFWVKLDEDDKMLKSFSTINRRAIRKAVREGVEIKRSENPDALDDFFLCYEQMCKRKNVPAVSENFFMSGIKEQMKQRKCELFYAEYQGQIYSYAIVSLFGRPTYHWGARYDCQNIPPMGQILHWTIMRFLRDSGYSIYDLGGAPAEILSADHPNYSVWVFKKRFNPDYVGFVGNAQYRYRPIMSGGINKLKALKRIGTERIKSFRRKNKN